MKYNIIGVKTTEYNFRDTGIAPAPDGKVEIKPQFSRVARAVAPDLYTRT